MSDTEARSAPDSRRPETLPRGRALVLLYASAAAIAMAGWLWFLGWLSWKIIASATGAGP
jgi:hypothetical protein